MAQPSNTFDSYDAVGIREDLSDIITNISPEENTIHDKVRQVSRSQHFARMANRQPTRVCSERAHRR